MEPDTSYNKVEWPFSGEAKRGGKEKKEGYFSIEVAL